MPRGMHHLPRLPRPYYQAYAVVHWTITFQKPSKGWLDEKFHATFRELMLHAAARQNLFCPTYVLMPDHIHFIWMGMNLKSDQLNAMRFLRTHLQKCLRNRESVPNQFKLQKQSHDNVLRDNERTHGAFAKTCFYILNNPVRAELVDSPNIWPYLGPIIPGHPDMYPLREDFLPMFWKLYERQREPEDPPALPPFSNDL